MEKHTLTPHESNTLTNALKIAAEKFLADAAEFKKLAAHIRAGKPFPMFAPGEDGARAADRLQEQFESQAKDCHKLIEQIDSFEDVVLISDPG